MAKIIEHRQIPLGDLVIGKGQVRTRDTAKGVEQLAASIEKQGLLQPIVVCQSVQGDKWEILTGQRRFLAHKMLRRETITAAVLDEQVNEAEAKAISITENLIRRKLSGPELIDGVTFLYHTYGDNARMVSEKTGIPYGDVLQYVKYPRLISVLKTMVDDGEVDLKVALRAQDAATIDDDLPKSEDAVQLAKEMKSMSDAQRRRLIKERKDDPKLSADDAIERARTGRRIVQVVVTLSSDAHGALKDYASREGVTQDEAAGQIIENALKELELMDE